MDKRVLMKAGPMLWVHCCFNPLQTKTFFLIIAGNEKSSKEGDATSRSGEGGLCDGILRGLQFGMLDTNCKCFFSHPLSPTFSCLFIRNICVLETIHRMAVAVINVKGPLFIRMADVGRHRDETQPIHHTVNNLVVWQIFGWEPVQWQIGHAKLVIKNGLKPLTISNLKSQKNWVIIIITGFLSATEHHNCPGHFGRIQLAHPVVNPLFVGLLASVLQTGCLPFFSSFCYIQQPDFQTLCIHCHRLRISPYFIQAVLPLGSRYTGVRHLQRLKAINAMCARQFQSEID